MPLSESDLIDIEDRANGNTGPRFGFTHQVCEDNKKLIATIRELQSSPPVSSGDYVSREIVRVDDEAIALLRSLIPKLCNLCHSERPLTQWGQRKSNNLAFTHWTGFEHSPCAASNVREFLERSPSSPVSRCVWKYDPDGYWQTQCGDQFCFSEGGPTENRVKFCHYCGKAMFESVYENGSGGD